MSESRTEAAEAMIGPVIGKIAAPIEEVYGARVCKDTILRITDKVTGGLTE